MLRRGYNLSTARPIWAGWTLARSFWRSSQAFVTDPCTHDIPMQTKMASSDLLVEYLQHTGSGLFAVPPGVRPGEHVGQTLFH